MKRWIVILFFLVLAIPLAALVTWLTLRDNFHVIVPGELYRSAQLSPGMLEEVVREHGIQTLVSLRRPRPDEAWYKKEIKVTESLGIQRHEIALDFTFSPRIDHLRDLRNLIENAPRPLLFYCRGGADRTGLAALMVKLLDGSTHLEEARRQISLEYWAVRDDTMGVYLYRDYSAWLEQQSLEHSTERFNHWLDDEYVDLSGNVHFLIDPIGDQLWQRPWGLVDEGHEFKIDRTSTDVLELTGWAFDTRNVAPLDSVEVHLGDVQFSQQWYGIYQPWLLKDFGREEYLDSGWAANHPLDQFEDGCHDLRIRFIRQDGSDWTSPPSARICIG